MKQSKNHKNKSWLIILLTLLVLLGSGGVYYLYQAGYIGVEKEQMHIKLTIPNEMKTLVWLNELQAFVAALRHQRFANQARPAKSE